VREVRRDGMFQVKKHEGVFFKTASSQLILGQRGYILWSCSNYLSLLIHASHRSISGLNGWWRMSKTAGNDAGAT
jgi:hypothetical protein